MEPAVDCKSQKRIAELCSLSKDSGGPVYRFVRKMGENREWAQDITQETHADSLAAIGTLRDESRVDGWVFSIARRKVYAAWRKRGKRPFTKPLGDSESIDESAEDNDDENPRVANIQECIKRLNRRERQIIGLLYYESMSVQDIARLLKEKLFTIHKRHQRARKRLFDCITAKFGAE